MSASAHDSTALSKSTTEIPYASQGDEKKQWPAWLMSALLHACVLIVLALAMQVTPRGAAVEPARRGGIVLAKPQANSTQYFSETDAMADAAAAESAATASSETIPLAEALPDDGGLSIDVAGALPSGEELAGIGGSIGEALPSAGDLTAGGTGSKRLGGDAKTYVFGVEGEGSRFVYVFDRSSSMLGFGGRPLAAAKRELIESLQSLGSTHQFQIIFYNTRFSVFNPNAPQPPRLLFADQENKTLAERFVQGISGSGGTRHLEPLRIALGMNPDVIFFLTDAADPQLTAGELDQIRRLNRGTSINAIEFGAGPQPGGDNFLMKLARQNNGKHAYVDVTRLGAGY